MRDAIVGGLIAGLFPVILFMLTGSRRIGNLQQGVRGLQDESKQIQSRLDTDREALTKQIDAVQSRLNEQIDGLGHNIDKHHKESLDGVSVLQGGLSDLRVELVDRLGKLESKVVDRVAHLEGELRGRGLTHSEQ